MKLLIFVCLLLANNCFASSEYRIFWDSVNFISNGHEVHAYFKKDNNENLVIELRLNQEIAVVEKCEIIKFNLDSEKEGVDLSKIDLFVSSNILLGEHKNDVQEIERYQSIKILYFSFLGKKEIEKEIILSFKNGRPITNNASSSVSFIFDELGNPVDYTCSTKK